MLQLYFKNKPSPQTRRKLEGGELGRGWFPLVRRTVSIYIYMYIYTQQCAGRGVFVPLQSAGILSDLANYSKVFSFQLLILKQSVFRS